MAKKQSNSTAAIAERAVKAVAASKESSTPAKKTRKKKASKKTAKKGSKKAPAKRKKKASKRVAKDPLADLRHCSTVVKRAKLMIADCQGGTASANGGRSLASKKTR